MKRYYEYITDETRHTRPKYFVFKTQFISLLCISCVICALYNWANIAAPSEVSFGVDWVNFIRIAFRSISFASDVFIAENKIRDLEQSLRVLDSSKEICVADRNPECASVMMEGHEFGGVCPGGRILTIEPTTMKPIPLANALWGYASVWAVWKLHNESLLPYVPRDTLKIISSLLRRPSIGSLASLPSHCLGLKRSRRLSSEEEVIQNPDLLFNTSIILEASTVRHRDVIKAGSDALRNEFKLSEELSLYMRMQMEEIKSYLGYSLNSTATFIGVQVQKHWCSHGRLEKQVLISLEECYARAINLMVEKHQDMVFIVLGSEEDDTRWLEKHLKKIQTKNSKWIKVKTASIASQFLLLTQCNHTIISNEGLWAFAALMSGGGTMVCSMAPMLKSDNTAVELSKILNNWHDMSSLSAL